MVFLLALNVFYKSLATFDQDAFVFLWKRPGDPGRIRGRVYDDCVATSKGYLQVSTGLMRNPPNNAEPKDIDRPFLAGAQTAINYKGKKLVLIWDTPKCKLARDERGWMLYQFQPGTLHLTGTTESQMRAVDEQTMGGNPDRGTLKIGSARSGMARDTVIQYLYLTNPIRRAPVPMHLYWDISEPELGVLGVAFSKGESYATQTSNPGSTRESPLSLGNLRTGRIVWSSPKYGCGFWLGKKRVLAELPRRHEWRLLDAKSGKEISASLPPTLLKRGSGFVQTSGSFLFVYDIEADSTYAYRFTG